MAKEATKNSLPELIFEIARKAATCGKKIYPIKDNDMMYTYCMRKQGHEGECSTEKDKD